MVQNSVVLVGRLSCDPVLKYSTSGTPVCSFNVTTEQAGAVAVQTFRRMAEICAQFLKAGREVLTVGSLAKRKGGLVLAAREIQFLGPRPEPPKAPPATDDDISHEEDGLDDGDAPERDFPDDQPDLEDMDTEERLWPTVDDGPDVGDL